MASYHIRISEASRNRLEKSRRQTGKSFGRLIDEALGVDEFTVSDEKINEWVKEGESTSPPKVKPAKTYSPLPKPCSAIIDAQILMCWEHQKNRIYRDRRHPTDVLGDISLTRKELLKAVRQKIKLGYYPRKAHAPIQLSPHHRTWGEVYPDWFKNHQKARSQFETYFDNRLIALVKQGILSRVQDGHYKLNALYPERRYQNEWAAIKGITLLAPQEGLNIPKLVTASPIVNNVKHENYVSITS